MRAAAGGVLAAGMLPAALTLSAGPAAAAGCYGYSCHGLDPTGRCTDTSDTVGYASVGASGNPRTVAIVHNKYSNGCKSNWAWATLTAEGYNDGDTLIVVISTTDSHGNVESMCYPGPNSTGALTEACNGNTSRASGSQGAYTDMVDGTKLTYATVFVYNQTGLIAYAGADQ